MTITTACASEPNWIDAKRLVAFRLEGLPDEGTSEPGLVSHLPEGRNSSFGTSSYQAALPRSEYSAVGCHHENMSQVGDPQVSAPPAGLERLSVEACVSAETMARPTLASVGRTQAPHQSHPQLLASTDRQSKYAPFG